MAYLDTVREVYSKAARKPQEGLCCTTSPIWRFPGLNIPQEMISMNYGCGSTIHHRDLKEEPTVLYVGVGGGLEVLQFAYFSRRRHAIIGVDPVESMIEACDRNLRIAEQSNLWFSRDFVSLVEGDALDLPVEDNSIDVAAQNCLFNIFRKEDLKTALKEVYRTLKPHGRLVLSDPICDEDIPIHLREDDHLRSLCISGAISLRDYIDLITKAGFGTVEVRARRPYRVLSKPEFEIDKTTLIESVEICAIKDPIPIDGPCVFTGRNAIYFGRDDLFDDQNGHSLLRNMPLSVCDKTAAKLVSLHRDDLLITEPTYFYDGGGCC